MITTVQLSPFRQKIYAVVHQIPRGKVASYGQVAALSGRPFAARAAGTVLQKTPADLDIPCHRVVNASGALAPAYAFGGPDIQRRLLEEEGVRFKTNGCVDMKYSQWRVDQADIE